MATDPQPQCPTPPRSIKGWGMRIVIGCGVLIGLVLFATLFADRHWFASLLCSFTVQYALLLIPISTVCIIARRWRWAMLFIMLLTVQTTPVLPYLFFFPPETHDKNHAGQNTFRLLVQNVQIDNRQHQRLLELIYRENPDAVLLLETDEQWIKALEPLHTVYPYYREVPFEGAFGISILSKTAWESCEVRKSGPDQLPITITQWGHGPDKITLIGTHPFPPISAEKAASRNTQLLQNIRILEARSDAYEGTKILAGDFNLTPWSPCFRKLLVDPYAGYGGYRGVNRTGQTTQTFRDAGIGYFPWPTWHLFPTLMGGVKIDHVLFHSEQSPLNYRVGPYIGSDHRAVIVDFEY